MAKDRAGTEFLVEGESAGVSHSGDLFNALQANGDVYIPFGAEFECEFGKPQPGWVSLLSDPLKPIPKATLELAKAIQKAIEKTHDDRDPPVKYAIKDMFVGQSKRNTATRAVAVVRQSGEPLSATVVNAIVKAFTERSLVPKDEAPREQATQQVDAATLELPSGQRRINVEEDLAGSPLEPTVDGPPLVAYQEKLLAAAHSSADEFVRANPGKRMSASVVTSDETVRYAGVTPLPAKRETPLDPIVMRCRIDVVAIKAYKVSFIEAAPVMRDLAPSASEAAWIPETFEAALGLDAKSETASPKELLKKVFNLTNEGAYLVDAHVLVKESRGRTRYRVVAIDSVGAAREQAA